MRRAAAACARLLPRGGRTSAAETAGSTAQQAAAWGLPHPWPPRFRGQQHQQRAPFRSRLPHATHPPARHLPKHGPRPPRSPLRRALGALGKALGLAAVGVPLAGVGALVVSGVEDADATELVLSVPRTLRAVWWGTQAGYRYKRLAARFPGKASEAYRAELALLHEEMAQGLLLLCQANGGVYIKAGQLAVSLRAVPEQYRRTLEVLQDKVPPRPFEDIQQALAAELGATTDELFSRFDPCATAAASLAQVHRAWLKDGTPVAVKVQYPGLSGSVMADVAGMLTLARAGARLFPDVNLVWLFEELQRKLSQELDFRIEARNAARLADCMRGRPGVAVPAAVPELSGRRVLCMEWVDGCKVSDEEGLQAMGLAPKDVGLLLLQAFADMTFVHGFVHGDPHPGNILVRPDWESQGRASRLLFGRRPRPQLVMLDHGLYIELPQDMRQQYCQLWAAFVLSDKDTAVQAATALGGDKAGRILPEVLRPRNWSQVSREERRKMRQESGLNSFADLTEILEQAPRALLDTLRLSAIVRHTAAQLGVTIADRLRVNATAAFHGMELRGSGGAAAQGPSPGLEGAAGAAAAAGGRTTATTRQAAGKGRKAEAKAEYYGVLQSRSKRWQLQARLWAMRGAFWLASVLQSLLDRLAPRTALLA